MPPSNIKKATINLYLEKYKENKDTVEVVTTDQSIKGRITIVEPDFISIVWNTEVTEKSPGTTDQIIVIYEIETFLMIRDIKSVSKILNSFVK